MIELVDPIWFCLSGFLGGLFGGSSKQSVTSQQDILVRVDARPRVDVRVAPVNVEPTDLRPIGQAIADAAGGLSEALGSGFLAAAEVGRLGALEAAQLESAGDLAAAQVETAGNLVAADLQRQGLSEAVFAVGDELRRTLLLVGVAAVAFMVLRR